MFEDLNVTKQKKQGGVAECHLAIYIEKYHKANKELWKNSNISPCKKYDHQKNPLKETKILQDNIITLL